jgi:hypothetical protein
LLRNALALGFTFALAACGGGNVAGNGNKPDHIVIEMVQNDVPQLTPGNIYQCQLAQMRAYLYFTDGSAGDFTNRVTWSVDASGSGDTMISNGDLPVNPADVTEGTYGKGVMIPGNTGHPTIMADYQGLIGRFDLSVLPADPATFSFVSGTNLLNTSIDPANPFQTNYLKSPVTQEGTGTLWLGAGTTYSMRVLAPLNGIETDVTSSARWDFVNGGDPNVLAVSSLGIISTGRAGGAQTLRARFPGCATEMTMPVAVANIQGLSIGLDPGFIDSNTHKQESLLVGNTERIEVLADLGQDSQGRAIPKQDVSGTVSFWISDSSLGTISQQVGGGAYLVAAAGGTLNMQATGNFGNQAQIQTPILQTSTTSGILSGLKVSLPSADAMAGMPAACQLGTLDSPVLQSGSVCYSPFTAKGTYVLPDGSSIDQDVSYFAVWTLSDSTLATIAGGVPYGGQVKSPTPADVPSGQSLETITVTIPGDTTNTTATSQLTLKGAS